MKILNALATAWLVVAVAALTTGVFLMGRYHGEKVGYQRGWDSACATFGPRNDPNLCSVSLYDAERYRKEQN